MKILQTTKCIICLKPATNHGGHLIDKNNKLIYAGWCDKHTNISTPDFMNKKGCCGGWHKKYGLEKAAWKD